ncbi:MAG: sulfatase [Bacteroidetes bacterium]|nr:sulfatase [Bacteroidota bacterium]
MRIFSKIQKQISYLIYSYLLVILIFFIFRLIIFPLNLSEIKSILQESQGLGLIVKSLIMGFRFDTVITSFILSPIIISLLISSIFKIKNRIFYKINHYYIVVFFSICFAISAIDIPYFKYFFSRFTLVGLTWLDSPLFVFKMIFQEPSFIIYFILFVVIIVLYSWLMYRIYCKTLRKVVLSTQNEENDESRKSIIKTYALNLTIYILLLLLCFLGMRGRVALKSPIRVGTAYFSNNPLINQIGLNPVYTFIKSVEEKFILSQSLELVSDIEAEKFVLNEFKDFYSQTIKTQPLENNVILVIMESMSAEYLGHFGNNSGLTPYLDSLANHSISFENVYTAGIHTYNGVYSTLFAQPALLDIHSMKKTTIPKMNGLPNILNREGYTTLYFTTHDDQFDNIGGFLMANGIEKIISQKDYPTNEVKSTLGVPDHIMFDRAINEINKLDKNKPFFSAMLTSSLHNPYVFPESISLKPKSKEIKDKMLEYSDWAIGQFLEKAKKTSWFENTIFVFIADHGAYIGKNKFDIPISYHHTPFFIYSPKHIMAEKNENLGLQIDLCATVLSKLGINYNRKESLGIDLNNFSRRYAYFSSDDKVGVLDQDYFYIWNKNGKEVLYKYRQDDSKNYLQEQRTIADEMKNYAFSMIQYSQKTLK